MRWYENTLTIEGEQVAIEGTFIDSSIKIVATYGDRIFVCMDKPIQMWSHQDILAEDIYHKYQGKIKKFEKVVLPRLLKADKTCGLG